MGYSSLLSGAVCPPSSPSPPLVSGWARAGRQVARHAWTRAAVEIFVVDMLIENPRDIVQPDRSSGANGCTRCAFSLSPSRKCTALIVIQSRRDLRFAYCDFGWRVPTMWRWCAYSRICIYRLPRISSLNHSLRMRNLRTFGASG